MDVDNLNQQIQEVHQRTLFLNNSQNGVSQSVLHEQTFEELRTALEELRVAEEELRQQNEELAIARQEVERERQRYQELFDFAPDGYLVTDTYGNIIEANRAAVELLKVEQRFLVGKPLVNFIPEENRSTFRYHLFRLRDIERIQDWEIQMQTRQGTKFYASISVITVVDSFGNPLGWRWLVRDITARKRAEEELRSTQIQNLELQEAARLKSKFLAVVSHELRSPMNAILGFSQLLLRRHSSQFSTESKNMVERIINNGQHLLVLIEEILDLSRLETSKLELKLHEFNIVELVTETIEELSPLAHQKNLSLDVRKDTEHLRVINDSARLRQVLVNLFSNAIKFTNTGGVIVEVKQFNQERVVLIVKDTGIGIPETDLPHVFKEFWQVDKSTTRKQSGVGLGLAIVDKLVRLMKGSITVESELGKGSIFRVELPRLVVSC